MKTTLRSIQRAPQRALFIAALAIHVVWLLAEVGAASAQSGAAAVAPTGQLRVVLNIGNPVLASKDSATGEVHGVTVDLSRALATKLGVPVVLVEYPNVARIVEGAQSGAWDIAFLAINPARAGDMDFTPPYKDLPGLPATHRPFAVRGASIVEFPDAKNSLCSDYWDLTTYMKQVGLVK